MSAGATQVEVINGLGSPAPLTVDAAGRLRLDPRAYERALDCVHCGLCLPACPTYTVNGLEADSPRGRIYLMKSLADGRIRPTDAVLHHLDLCLDCRGCETACPSGVVYHELIEDARTRLAPTRKKDFAQRFIEAMCLHVFPHPMRLKLALLTPRVLQKFGLWRAAARMPGWPAPLAKMRQMLPAQGPLWETRLLRRYPARAADGQVRARVGLFAGCVGSVLFQDVNRQAIALLQRAGCEVLVPRVQVCCGAIHHHAGHVSNAQRMARTNIEAFAAANVDFVVTAIAGCGAMLKEYGHLLRDDPPHAAAAGSFARTARDISQALVELGVSPAPQALKMTVTYHDACHLLHAQGVGDAPRTLLAAIPGLTLVPLPESDLCCGAAGTYNLAQPTMSRQLADRKLANIQATGARVVATGNVGCAMQIQSEADRRGIALRVVHPVTLLHEACFGEKSAADGRE